MKPWILVELSKCFGSYDLLTAYIMRNHNIGLETATDITYLIGQDLERWVDEILESRGEEN